MRLCVYSALDRVSFCNNVCTCAREGARVRTLMLRIFAARFFAMEARELVEVVFLGEKLIFYTDKEVYECRYCFACTCRMFTAKREINVLVVPILRTRRTFLCICISTDISPA